MEHDPTGEPPRRKRRPWWRWNLTTIAGVLFVALWLRELLKWHYSTTWLVAATVFALWLLGPLPFVERVHLARLPPAVRRTREMLDRSRPPIMVGILRNVGLLTFGLASIQLVLSVGWWLFAWSMGDLPFDLGRNRGFWFQLVGVLSSSVMPAIGGGTLYLLAVIAERLWLHEPFRPANPTQAADSTRSIE